MATLEVLTAMLPAMRYTEARLSRIAAEMLRISGGYVDFSPNYDESLEEPLVLPSRFPTLLEMVHQVLRWGWQQIFPP